MQNPTKQCILTLSRSLIKDAHKIDPQIVMDLNSTVYIKLRQIIKSLRQLLLRL